MHRILLLAANPEDISPLRLPKEVHDIQEGLRRSQYRDQFDVRSEGAVSARGLRRALLDHQPELIHFSGHGSEEGIVLEDDSGATHRVGAEALADLFSHFADHLHCVVLNACNSQPQAEAISRVIPYAIGMRDKITDEAAIEFAVGFYDAVGAGRTIDEAFAIGCSAIRAFGLPDHSVPVLNRRPAQDDAPAPGGGERERASRRRDQTARPRATHGRENPTSGTRKRAEIAPFFQFLQTALRLGLQSGSKRFAPRIVGAVLYAAVIALLIAALFWLRDPAVLRIAFFASLSLALLIFALIALPDLHPYVGNSLATLVTLCFVATIVWGAVEIATIPDEPGPPLPTPEPRRFEATGRIRFSDHRPAEGAEVSIPLLRLSDRTNANGTFYLGQIDHQPGADTVDLQIAIGDTVFLRRIALDASPLDIVLAYLPRAEAPPASPDSVPPGRDRPGSRGSAPPEREPEQRLRSVPTPGSVVSRVNPEPEREPEPRPQPVPTSGSVVGHVNAAIGGEQYKHYGMTVTGSGTCRLHGRVQVLRGGARDIQIVVLTAEEFEIYRVKGPYSEIFKERRTSDYTLDVELPGPGRYELVISNRTSWLTPKYVLVENVRWECAGGGS